MRLSVLYLLGLLGLSSLSVSASPVFVNGIAIPGSTGDESGTSVNNGRLGFFSDLYFDPIRNQWWGLSDRGPGGGTLAYDTRIQQFSLSIDPNTGAISNFQVIDTIKFTNNGQPMTGLAPNPVGSLGNSFDPEGIVINPSNGHFFVSDEYGPSVYEFDQTGALVRQFTTPANLVPRNAGTNVKNFADDTGNTAGKRTNRGFEGLAISPDGRYTFAMLQSSMLDEGGGNGVMNRIVKFDNTTGLAVAQYAYEMDTAGQGRGISALVAINDHEFLVLERNNRGIGVGATITPADKRVYKIDIAGASDVSAIDLDAPAAVYTKVTKAGSVFIDLDANTLAALGNKSPEKWEGLAIGPRLNDGSYVLLAGTDSDYSVTQNAGGTQFDVYFRFTDADPFASSISCPLGLTTGCTNTTGGAAAILTAEYSLVPGVLHSYKVSAADLGNFVSPAAVPEPSTWILLGTGTLIAAWRKRRA